MKSHHVTLTEPVTELVKSQIASGRFKDFSAAMQEAAWNYFCGTNDALAEYGVTAEQVERRYQKDIRETRTLKKAGKLTEWKP